MNIYMAMNWGAWALAAILFSWLLYDFIKTEKSHSPSVIEAVIDQDEV